MTSKKDQTFNVYRATFHTAKALYQFLLDLGSNVTFYAVTNQVIGTERRDILLVTPSEVTLAEMGDNDAENYDSRTDDSLTLTHDHKTRAQLLKIVDHDDFHDPKTLATAAAKQAREEELARQHLLSQRQQREARKLFLKWFHRGPEVCEVSGSSSRQDIVLRDGAVTLRFCPDSSPAYQGFKLQGYCPDCGEVCWSVDCTSLAHLGEQFSIFRPDKAQHQCFGNQPKTPPSLQSAFETLDDALRDYVEEIVHDCQS